MKNPKGGQYLSLTNPVLYLLYLAPVRKACGDSPSGWATRTLQKVEKESNQNVFFKYTCRQGFKRVMSAVLIPSYLMMFKS